MSGESGRRRKPGMPGSTGLETRARRASAPEMTRHARSEAERIGSAAGIPPQDGAAEKPAAAEAPARGYHHGNLREELVAAALADLETRGAHALSLRDIAARLGVSKTAPYRHFADKPALLSALVAEGFRRLADRMDAALTAPDAPLEIVRRMGRAYVDFAAERPGLYRLMFSAEGFHLSSEACRAAGDRALGALHAAVACAQSAGWRATEDTAQLTLMLWAYVHGVAGLRLEGLLPPTPDDATWHRLAEGFVGA